MVKILEDLCLNCMFLELNCDSKATAETHETHLSRLQVQTWSPGSEDR